MIITVSHGGAFLHIFALFLPPVCLLPFWLRAGVTWLTDPSRGVEASEAQEFRRLLLGLKSV